ncbi:glucose 1-dehydrogenase [bacterium]|nr:glucose 1-dehydrogenase [bacterium]
MKRTVIITGGSRGIGQGIALKFLQNNYNVVITTRHQDQKEAILKYYTDHGCDAPTLMIVDVTKEDEVKNLVEETVNKFGKVDVFVNNAGITMGEGPIGESKTEDFVSTINTNLLGTYFGMKYAIKAMLKTGGGQIVNIASFLGIRAAANTAFYTATKHAVIGLTKATAIDYATKGIRINAVAPGAIKTEIFQKAIAAGKVSEESLANLAPMKKMGEPKDVAEAVYFLASVENTFLTGSVLCVDGGLSDY